MAETPLVSICIPTYRRYEQLKVCLFNALNQDYENIEVIVSDDTDDEDTPLWLLKLAKEDSRLLYIRQEKRLGMMPNDNFVRKIAKGEFVCVMHNDDVFPLGYISNLMDYLLQNPDCTLVGPSCARYLEGAYWHHYENYSNESMTRFERLRDIAIRTFENPWSFEHLMYGVYRKDAVPENFNMGHWRCIIFFHYLCSMTGYIHTLNDLEIEKNTTWDDIKKYAAAGYIKRNKFMIRLFNQRKEARITALFYLFYYSYKSVHLGFWCKLKLSVIGLIKFFQNKTEQYYPLPSQKQNGYQAV